MTPRMRMLMETYDYYHVRERIAVSPSALRRLVCERAALKTMLLMFREHRRTVGL